MTTTEIKGLLNMDCIELAEGITIHNASSKIKEIEKMKSLYDRKLYSILFPDKEGKMNFRHLDDEKKEKVLAQYPFIQKMNRKWQYRTMLKYFPGEGNNEMIVSEYNTISDFIIGLSFIISLVPGFICGFKSGMALIKKISGK